MGFLVLHAPAKKDATLKGRCYSGSAGALGFTESIHVNVRNYESLNGHMDLTGTGALKLKCFNHSFTKSGKKISSDLSDCVKKDIATVSAIEYCSDQDAIKVTVKDALVPIPVSAQLTRVDCPSMEDEPLMCSGSADPVVVAPQCYSGSKKLWGELESVELKILRMQEGRKGTLELTGSGLKRLDCEEHSFSKSGQDLSVDLRDCVPDETPIRSVKYCSDQDSILVTGTDASSGESVTGELIRVDCTTKEVSV